MAITFNGNDLISSCNVAYATCSTAAATAAKVATVQGNANWQLKSGSIVVVSFSNTNTVQNPTLNVNNTGAKQVYYNGAAVTTTNVGKVGTAGRPSMYMYNGTYYVFLGWAYEQDTTYSAVTTSANGLMIKDDKTKLDATNIAYVTCGTAAATAAKVCSLSGNSNWKLATGSIIVLSSTNTNTAENPTLNVNNTGAKSIWYNGANITTSNLNIAGCAGRPILYMYSGTSWVFLGWAYDTNTTYSNAGLGNGYGTCSTAADTTAKAVTMSGYTLTTNGMVAIKFTYAVPAGATLNINSKGTKAIYHKGATIKAGVINAGDIATFIYDGTYYVLLSVDTSCSTFTKSGSSAKAGLVPAPSTTEGTTKYLREDGTWQVPPDNNTVYTHPAYTARTGKPTDNLTPSFGGTATISQITSDATGHVTGATDRTIKIPSTLSNGNSTAGLIKTSSTVTSNSGYTACPVISGVPYFKNTTYSTATASAAGLMSAADKTKLDTVVSNAKNVAWKNFKTDTLIRYGSEAGVVVDIDKVDGWNSTILAVGINGTNCSCCLIYAMSMNSGATSVTINIRNLNTEGTADIEIGVNILYVKGV